MTEVRAPTDTAEDAARIAGGSGQVFLGGLIDRALRWVLKWFMAGLLGPASLGVYEIATRIGGTITAFSPLGLDTGVVLFIARYRKEGDRSGIKGTVIASLATSLVLGLLSSLGLTVCVWQGWIAAESRELSTALYWLAPVILIWTPLLTLIGLLRSVKDMRRSTLAYQVILPLGILCFTLPVVWMGGGAAAAIVCLGLATLGATLAAARAAWGHFRPALRDKSLAPRIELGALLRFSVPQSLTAAAFRLNQFLDVLFLGALADAHTVGVYAVAASIAGFGTVPSNAVISMFNPFVAELTQSGELHRLNRLLRSVTRWLVVISLPVFLLLILLPDLVLRIYPTEYRSAGGLLTLLALGQVVQTICAPAMRLIPMSGHALLNLANGAFALGLNVVLNLLLIPRYGGMGAAWAGAITLSAWSVWRLAEVWWLLRCWPFDGRTLTLLGVAAVGGIGIHHGLPAEALSLKVGATFGLILLVLTLVPLQGKSQEDAAVLARLHQKIAGLRKRLGRSVGNGDLPK